MLASMLTAAKRARLGTPTIGCTRRSLATFAPITWGGDKKIPGLIYGKESAPAVIVVR